MFGYEILRNQWAILALFTGIAAVLYVALFYLDLGQPRKYRKGTGQKEHETKYLSVWQGIPWSIKVTIALLFVYGVVYSIYAVLEPKSW